MICDLNRLQGRIDALKTAGFMDKAAIAEGVLDEFYAVVERQQLEMMKLSQEVNQLKYARENVQA